MYNNAISSKSQVTCVAWLRKIHILMRVRPWQVAWCDAHQWQRWCQMTHGEKIYIYDFIIHLIWNTKASHTKWLSMMCTKPQCYTKHLQDSLQWLTSQYTLLYLPKCFACYTHVLTIFLWAKINVDFIVPVIKVKSRYTIWYKWCTWWQLQ